MYSDVDAHLIKQCFNDEENLEKYISGKVNFHGIEYRETISVCVGKNDFGNFIVCKIHCIIINSRFSNIVFVGRVKEIVFNSHVGVYENSSNEAEDEVLSSFPYSSLLSPDPFLEVTIAGVLVYVPKYTPLDPNL